MRARAQRDVLKEQNKESWLESYVLEADIDQGQNNPVWRGSHCDTGSLVAVKAIDTGKYNNLKQ